MTLNLHLLKHEYNQDYFDNVWYQEALHSQRNKLRTQLITRYVPKHSPILEIGCGQGFLLHELSADYTVDGLEISAHAADYAHTTFHLTVKQADIQQVRLKKSSYAGVVAFNILEQLPNPAKVIERLYASLQPGGVLIGSVPNNHSLLGTIVTAITNIVDKTHCSTLTPVTWNTLFTHAGFSSIQFFSENPCGRNRGFYNYHRIWPHTSLNLMFVCIK